jgi:putative transposase
MVAPRESAGFAKKVSEETCEKQQIQPNQAFMPTADPPFDQNRRPCCPLSMTKTHSRPYTSNDNPYSKSQFRTMKYRPEFPDRFECI